MTVFHMARGLIRRRILVNFRVDPEVMLPIVPPGFRIKELDGYAVAGICLIRLEELRPASLPWPLGLASENAAHRVAVGWADREAVFIPRRDTNSRFVLAAGGRLFPGEHHQAAFEVHDDGSEVDFWMRSLDGEVEVRLTGHETDGLPPTSRFASMADASNFFATGSVGYSTTRSGGRLEGLRLTTNGWTVSPLAIDSVYSSYFADRRRFPKGSVEFDCALIMRNIEHEWTAAVPPALETVGLVGAGRRH
jgi:hypothetical protein